MGSDGRLRTRCRVTTALCCTLAPLLAVIAASPARAADECGAVPPGGGTVECPTADYPDGISYDAGVEDLTVVVDPGSTVEGGFNLNGQSDLSALLYGVSVSSTDDFISAVSVNSTGGRLILHVADASTSGDGAAGVYARDGGGYAAVYSGTVATTGDGSAGVQLIGDYGYQVVVADFTHTMGDGSAGVSVGTKSGDVFAMTFGVETDGDDSDGIQISSGSGDIVSQSGQHILLGQVTTHGDHSDAIDLSTVDGDITSRSQYVTTSGDQSDGIHAVSGGGDIAIYNGFNTSAGVITTYGDLSDGIHAESGGNIGIVSDTVRTHGAGSDGIDAVSSGGSTFIASNSVETYGGGRGIVADAAQDLAIVSGSIATEGKYATGISAVAHGGNVSIGGGGDISTNGDSAFGIIASAAGSIDADVGDVSTNGFYSRGIQLVAGGDIKLRTGDVSTHSPSFAAAGITAIAGGAVSIAAGSLDVYGSHSYGIYAYATGDISIAAEAVKTRHTSVDGYAAPSAGIVAVSTYGDMTIDAGSIDTAGVGVIAFASGYYSSGDALVTADSIRTTGDLATGVRAVTRYGDSEVRAGSVFTDGYYSGGIWMVGNGDKATFGDIQTTGDFSFGAYARSGQGGVAISGDLVSTSGYAAFGVSAIGDGGAVSISADSVKTEGLGGFGLVGAALRYSFIGGSVEYFGNLDIVTKDLRTYGDFAGGIYGVTQAGDVRIDAGHLETHGAYALGIQVISTSLYAPDDYLRSPSIVVTGGDVATFGDRSDAISIYSGLGGSVDVDVDSVKVEGTYSAGVVVDTPFVLFGNPAPVDVNLDIGSVEVGGTAGVGVLVFDGAGSVTIHVDSVEGTGHNASGIVAFGRNGASLDVSVGTIGLHDPGGDYAFFSPGLYAVSSGGNVTASAGTVTTEGDESGGLIVASNGTIDYYGQIHIGDVSASANEISTLGDYSIGAAATSSGGSVDLTVGSVETHGDYSIGIAGNALSLIGGYGASDHTLHGGDLNIVAGDVVTTGDHSDGVNALGFSGGDTNVTVGTVETSGADSYGLNVVTSGQANYYTGEFYSGSTTVTVDKVTTSGSNSTGVRVFAFTGDVDLTVGSVETTGIDSDAVVAINGSSGSVVVNILDQARSTQGFGVAASAYDNVDVSIAEGARVFGGKVGVYAGAYADGAAAHIINRGEIRTGGDGIAILATGQGITIDNAGAVIGPVRLTDHDDVFNNDGLWQSFGANRFGLGNDLVVNAGQLIVGAGQAGAETDWSALETLDNRGLVTMTDGHADQVFDLNATAFIGGAGSRLAIDVATTATGITADQLQLGAASGSTRLLLNGTGGLGRVLVVDASSSTAANNFSLSQESVDLGLVRMSLDYDAAKSDWSLVGAPDQEVFEGVRFGAQAQSLWRRAVDVWSLTMDESPSLEHLTLWGRYLTGHEDQNLSPGFSVLGTNLAPALDTDAEWNGAVLGASFGHGGWTWGALAAVTRQTTRFTFDDNKLRAKGTSFGAYAGWRGEKLFARALANYQHVRAKADLMSAGANDTIHGSISGLRAEAGLDLAAGALEIRPLVSVDWTHGHLGDLRAPGGDLDFRGFTSLEGSVGASLSGAFRIGSVPLHPYAGIYAVHEFAADNALDFNIGSQSLRLVDRPKSDYAKATAGFAADLGRTARISIGGEVDAFGGRNAVKGVIGLTWHG
jgi:hypothetical protein